jgi:hypothetical protein
MREVRWRLFRREDLPARLRRIERLDEIAFSDWPQDDDEGERDEPTTGG